MICLVDADFIKYLIVYDIQRMYKAGLDPKVEIPYNTIVKLVEVRVQKIFESTASRAHEYVFLFSGKTSDNYRALVSNVKQYKGTRKSTPTINNEKGIRNTVEEYIRQTYHYFKYPDLEADDLCVMGHNKNTFIYSNDKDLLTSPGLHYDIKAEKFITVTEEEGLLRLMRQTLTGDSVDNIAGLHKCGKVCAENMTKGLKGAALVHKVLDEYMKVDGPRDGLNRFVEMYSLVNLKTHKGDYTQEKYSEFFYFLDELISKEEDDLI